LTTPHAPAADLEALLAPYRGTKGTLLEALHLIQEHFGWISPESLDVLGRVLNMTRNQLWGVVTFYADFRTQPPPPYAIGICHGPTCHIQGSERIQSVLEHHWRIRQGVPNSTGQVELQLLQCSGLCHLAPWLTVNGQTTYTVGIPVHWGFVGITQGAMANLLTPFVGDVNTRCPEFKAFLVNIDKA